MKRVPLYVINNFITFDRKIYQLFGLHLGRPIRLKSVFYFFVFGLAELLVYFTPVLGALIRWIPAGILFALPVMLAWLLADVGTENRSPLSYFRSFVHFHMRKMEKVVYVKGKKQPQPKEHALSGFTTYSLTQKQKKAKPNSRYGFTGHVSYKQEERSQYHAKSTGISNSTP